MASGFESMKTRVNSALESIKAKWEKIKEVFSKPIKGVISVAGGAIEKTKNLFHSHATGLDSVPYDDYPANLHKDEMVLTASASRQFRELGGTKDSLPSLFNSESAQSITTTNNTREAQTFSPSITINYIGKEEEAPKDIASEVRKELDNFFKEMQLQRS